MAILVIDTSLAACQVGVFEPGGQMLAGASEAMERGHQERLAPMAAEVMEAGRQDFSNLAKIAVTVGPGSFTGLRVGLAFAKGLHLATGAPLAGVGTLEALAGGDGAHGLVVTAVDARRGRLYWQAFQDGAPLGEPQATPIDDVAAQLKGRAPVRLAGPGAALLREAFPNAAVEAIAAPDLSALGRHAMQAPPAANLRPIYLRPAVAHPA